MSTAWVKKREPQYLVKTSVCDADVDRKVPVFKVPVFKVPVFKSTCV